MPWRGKCPHEMGHLAIVGVKVNERALKLLAKERYECNQEGSLTRVLMPA